MLSAHSFIKPPTIIKTGHQSTFTSNNNPNNPCVKLLYDYISCIHRDETCCADIYENYCICKTKEMCDNQSKNM